jgi:hypothetical protein
MPGMCPFLLSFESLAQLRCTLNVNFLTRHNLARSMRLVIPTLLESTPKPAEIEAPLEHGVGLRPIEISY